MFGQFYLLNILGTLALSSFFTSTALVSAHSNSKLLTVLHALLCWSFLLQFSDSHGTPFFGFLLLVLYHCLSSDYKLLKSRNCHSPWIVSIYNNVWHKENTQQTCIELVNGWLLCPRHYVVVYRGIFIQSYLKLCVILSTIIIPSLQIGKLRPGEVK